MRALTLAKKASSVSTRTPSAARAFEMLRHAACASGVAALFANSRVWFVPPSLVGMADGGVVRHASVGSVGRETHRSWGAGRAGLHD